MDCGFTQQENRFQPLCGYENKGYSSENLPEFESRINALVIDTIFVPNRLELCQQSGYRLQTIALMKISFVNEISQESSYGGFRNYILHWGTSLNITIRDSSIASCR